MVPGTITALTHLVLVFSVSVSAGACVSVLAVFHRPPGHGQRVVHALLHRGPVQVVLGRQGHFKGKQHTNLVGLKKKQVSQNQHYTRQTN